MLEKEGYAVINTLNGMHWLVDPLAGFDLYTDHNNRVFLFDPLEVFDDMSQSSLRKVIQWAIKLGLYNYTCYHIKEERTSRQTVLSDVPLFQLHFDVSSAFRNFSRRAATTSIGCRHLTGHYTKPKLRHEKLS